MNLDQMVLKGRQTPADDTYRGSAQLQLRSLVNPSELSSARRPYVNIYARYFSQHRHDLCFHVEMQPVDARNDAHQQRCTRRSMSVHLPKDFAHDTC